MQHRSGHIYTSIITANSANLLSLRLPPLLLSAELLQFLVAPPLLPLVLFPQLTFSLLLLQKNDRQLSAAASSESCHLQWKSRQILTKMCHCVKMNSEFISIPLLICFYIFFHSMSTEHLPIIMLYLHLLVTGKVFSSLDVWFKIIQLIWPKNIFYY